MKNGKGEASAGDKTGRMGNLFAHAVNVMCPEPHGQATGSLAAETCLFYMLFVMLSNAKYLGFDH